MSDAQQQQNDQTEQQLPTEGQGTPTTKLGRTRTESKVILDESVKHSSSSFLKNLEYGVESVQGHRKTMEDQHKATTGDCPVTPRGDGSEVKAAQGIPFFGVYDGHGGTQCADFLRGRLHALMLSHPQIRSDPTVACTEAVLQAEDEFMTKCRNEKLESGSTVAVALIIGDSLVSVNVGDSEIVLCRDGQAELLTTKHHLSASESEGERIKAVGGRIFHNRVGHPKFNPSLVSLAVTRAIGDAGFKLEEYTDGKASGVIADPDVKIVSLQAADSFFIMACDGLWDVMKYQDAINYCQRLLAAGASPEDVSKSIVQEALDRGSNDNVTVMIVALRKPAPFMGDREKGENEGSSLPTTEVADSAKKPEAE